jgi:hypothetical protein
MEQVISNSRKSYVKDETNNHSQVADNLIQPTDCNKIKELEFDLQDLQRTNSSSFILLQSVG